eukprot:CAMPEP_0205937000 /NCGR_PEP_ID=MMETSP1325-20131115/42950_1 /ASSEMBLY_ACC=CAM_ASM_000708 /TAXON_ID=236786 /ORGANISM="Florenciella sp., Strain RCC1007" /LENGTH=67 /DNA_ID=CAMNT_0053307213 /DNA_START=21 /DNA_END=224 /DNA_ORIENTATION=+
MSMEPMSMRDTDAPPLEEEVGMREKATSSSWRRDELRSSSDRPSARRGSGNKSKTYHAKMQALESSP